MFLACGFFLKNNSFNLLFQFVLTHQGVIIVVRLIRANLGTNEFSLNEVFYNHLQRLTILSYIARKNNGNMTIIMDSAARLTFPVALTRKKIGTPMSAAAPKQSNCRFVRLKNTFVFTLVRSRGTGIYAAKQFPPSLSER